MDIVFRDFNSARTRALFILDRAPQNAEAPLLLVEATTNPQELAAARERLKQLPPAIVESGLIKACRRIET